MSLFGKTIIVHGGLNSSVKECFEALAEAVGERFRDTDKEIAALKLELEALKRERESESRQSLAQKLRSKGIIGP